jgi:ornithine carbamoyltransferase
VKTASRMGPNPFTDEAEKLFEKIRRNTIRQRNILSINDLSTDEINLALEIAAGFKSGILVEYRTFFHKERTLALLFEKDSLRTLFSLQMAIQQLGGYAIHHQGLLDKRESVAHVAKSLASMGINVIVARTFRHKTVEDLAANARIPVINGLSDREHPLQALADLLTIQEEFGKLQGVNLAYVGDGNNVANSLMLAAAKTGMHFTIGCPDDYQPDSQIWNTAHAYGTETGANITCVSDPYQAVRKADAVYTDTWVSMGHEAKREERIQALRPYQVNSELLSNAKDSAIVMHCLPANCGEEITSVIDGGPSRVFEQAKNRLHTAKALLALVLAPIS